MSLPMRLLNIVRLATLCSLAFLVTGCSTSTEKRADTDSPATPKPSLSIISISPNSVSARATAMTLTVNGTGFTTQTVIQVNGLNETTTYVSPTQVTALVAASQLISGADLR